jgi:hypothetical protein
VVEIAAVADRSFAVTPKNDVANNHRESSEAIFAEIISLFWHPASSRHAKRLQLSIVLTIGHRHLYSESTAKLFLRL